MQSPKIETRTADGLLKALKDKAAEALPGWEPKEGEAGLALMRIYAHMAEEVVNRLNKVPRKHFTAFLDMLGISLLPAAPALAPVSFSLSEGAEYNVLIPKGTPVAAGEKDVTFETQKNMLASPARLIYSVPTSDTIYLGFDKQIQKGPLSIYFSIEPPEQTGKTHGLAMYCSTGQGEWKPLKIADYTRNMNESGAVEFFAHPGLVKTKTPYFEEWENLYWLKVIVDREEWRDMPHINAAHMNTTIVAQLEHVKDEIVGSSDGNAGQEFFLLRTPVISEEIMVDETGKPDQLSARTPGEAPVRWRRVEDFFDSSSTDRHYMMDPVSGALVFGSGIAGKIPPLGKDNIIANYMVGGGKKGNVDAFEIGDMKTSIPYLDRVVNPEPARGGGDNERIEDVLKRGPYLIKHRNRAVTLEDFQRMAVDVSGSIARAKAVLKDDRLILMVIPREPVDKPLPSPVLLKEVKDRLIGHSINTLSASNIVVRGPGYVEVSISVRIVPVSYEDAPLLETNIIDRLREYLHPLTGGPDRRGWEFGRGLHISDVYALLESMEGVDHAEDLRLNEAEADVGVSEFQTLCTGTHKIVIF
jgi:hypothetical protein